MNATFTQEFIFEEIIVTVSYEERGKYDFKVMSKSWILLGIGYYCEGVDGLLQLKYILFSCE